jgi:hypothetical protein
LSSLISATPSPLLVIPAPLMNVALKFTSVTATQLRALESDRGVVKRLNAVRKALGYFEKNPRHPALNTHKFSSMQGAKGEDVVEAYTENKTPVAYRIDWHYGPDKRDITILGDHSASVSADLPVTVFANALSRR